MHQESEVGEQGGKEAETKNEYVFLYKYQLHTRSVSTMYCKQALIKIHKYDLSKINGKSKYSTLLLFYTYKVHTVVNFIDKK